MAGDIPNEELRRTLHQTADLIADYLAGVGDRPVLPAVEPGEVTAALPRAAPVEGETFEAILEDYSRIIEPNVGHWNHPGFMAYFAISGSGPGIAAEALTAALNVNAMLWRSAPAATELEHVVCDWLRDMVGLPAEFRGHINDTASISTMLALAAARHAQSDLDVRRLGLAGRPEVPRLRVYCSEETHSSIDKAMMALGLGHDNLRKVAADERFAMRPERLAEAIEKDLAAGHRPIAVVATVGTTSSTGVDPLLAIADLCRRNDLWLHVDAAYAGSAAICPELREHFAGWERADSIVFNPHKWLLTPLDCSLLYVRDIDLLRSAFSLVPEYLKTGDGADANLMDLGVQLGRRFRSLKLWMVIRRFGVKGLQETIREHCRLARRLGSWIDEDSEFELCAPIEFSLVCFRWRPAGVDERELDALNERLLAAVNAAGPFFISHTQLAGRYVLRVAIGNVRTQEKHVAELWELVRRSRPSLAPPTAAGDQQDGTD